MNSDFVAACKHFLVHPLVDQGKEYIDYLGFPGNEVQSLTARGEDSDGRLFFLFKLIIHTDDGPRYCWDTIFQRFSTDPTNWKICGHYSMNCLANVGQVSEPQFQFYIDLATKGRSVITEEMRPSSRKWIGCKVTIGTEETWAARVIQRNWRLFSHLPNYYMCRRVRIRQMMNMGLEVGLSNIRPMFISWSEEDFRKVFPGLFTQ